MKELSGKGINYMEGKRKVWLMNNSVSLRVHIRGVKGK